LNWILNYCTNSIRYLCRRGIGDYEPGETYTLNDIVRGDDSCLYQSLTRENVGNIPGASPATWGRVSFYGRTREEIAAAVMPTDFSYPELNVLRYGADNTGRSPCDAAISKALSVACPIAGSAGGARRVDFPAGDYLVTSPIDLSNSRQSGTHLKDGLMVKGDSAGGTRIIGKTGSGKAVIETTGAQWLSIEDLTITGAPTGFSTVGIFQGLSKTLGETQNQKFTRLVILMNDDPSANGGAGSVGIWNFGAEESTYDTIWVHANLPMMLTAHNPSPSTGFKTPASYQSLAAVHSLGVTTFTGECFLVAVNKRQPSIITEDTNSMKFANTYLANLGTGGTNESAWKVYGSLAGVDYNGLIESHARLLEVSGTVQGANMRVTFGGVDSPKTERLLLHRGGQGQLLNSTFNMVDNVASARPLLAANPASPNELISCYIANCSFKMNCDQQYTAIPENLLWNPNTGNIIIEALRDGGKPYRYAVDANRTQEVSIPDTTCLARNGTSSAEIVRVLLPTTAGSRSALAASVSIEGIAHISNPSTGSMSCKFVEAQVSLAISNTGLLAVTTDVRLNGTTANTDAVDNEISSFSITTANGADGKYLQIIGVPTRTGANGAAVNFVGTARLRWMGNEPRAPSLRVLS
jgi:hypothetical protein